MAIRRPSGLNIALILVSAGGLTWLIVAEHGYLTRAMAGVGHAKPGLIIAAIGCERASIFFLARMQRRLLRASGQRLDLVSVMRVIIAGNALSVSVPLAGAGLGAAFSYREFDRLKIKRHAVAFALVISGVLSTVSLMVIVAAGALASGNTVAGLLGLLGAAAVVAGVTGLALGLRFAVCQRAIERLAIRALLLARRIRSRSDRPAEAVVAEARAQLASLHLRWTDWAAAAAFAFLNWLGDAACLFLSIRAAGLDIPLRDLLLVWSAGMAASSIGFTPGGIGIVEVALVAALAATGLPAAGASVAVMIYRLISLWLIMMAGWMYFFVLRSRAARRAPGPADEVTVDAAARPEM